MPLRMDAPLPPLEGGTDWFNSEPIKAEDLKGHPVLVHFWSISCGICKESLPDLNRWVDEYGPKGLKIISVHMPRQESDTNVPEVKKVMEEWECKQPIVVDNWHTITDGFENKYVPALYLFDADHKMRHFQAGEKAVKMTEPVIQRVLGLTQTV
jgi:thiol-disulfide isomerase/thioredoxin